MIKTVKSLISVVIFTFGVLLSGCDNADINPNSDKKPPLNGEAKELHDLVSLSADTRAKFLELAPLEGGDPKLALLKTLDWLRQQEGVTNAYHEDSIYLTFDLVSGLSSMFWVNEVAADGSSKLRGKGMGQLSKISTNEDCENEIENKDVLIYAPGYDEFLYEMGSKVPALLRDSDIIEDVDILKNEEASIEKISTFSNYGLVLIETHGKGNMFMTGDGFSFSQADIPSDLDQFRNELLNQIGQEHFDNLISGKVMAVTKAKFNPDSDWWANPQQALEAGEYVLYVTSSFLEGSPSLSNTVVFGNFCYSGWTTPVSIYPKPIGQAFLDLNPISYYAYQRPNGYSRPVDNLESMALEDSVISGLLTDNENTGRAHLKADDTKFQTSYPDLFLEHFGQPDWCYDSCGEELVDGRDGKVYKTVCIGDQVWMAENLNYSPAGGYCYDNISSNCDTYGRLYHWEEIVDNIADTTSSVPSGIQGICPEGWHIPSFGEWNILMEELGGHLVAGKELKGTRTWNPGKPGTNSVGFNALASGSASSKKFTPIRFSDMGNTAWFFSTTHTSEFSNDGIMLKTFLLNHSTDNVSNSAIASDGGALSCRCVKD